jgi:dTDP-4-dehydrorhamnose reductase
MTYKDDMSTAVIGAGGQLGRDLVASLTAAGESVTPLTHDDVDICDSERTRAVLADLQPQRIINTAAYHQVDACEDHAAEAFAVNAFAVRDLARICDALGSTLVHFSTDFVFGGGERSPYHETDAPLPESVYATSKLAGEYFAQAYCPRHVIVRTCGLYGHGGSRSRAGNFVEKMLQLAAQRPTLRVVADQIVTPTFTRDLAETVVGLLGCEALHDAASYYGIYHITNAGQCSWYEFAEAIFAETGTRVDLQAATAAEYARRPAYSVLAHTHLLRLGLPELRPWRDALREYLAERESTAGT